MTGVSLYLTDSEVNVVVRALSSLGMAYSRMPKVYPRIGWLVGDRASEIDRCRTLIKKLHSKQTEESREYAPLLEERDG